jgi:lysyl-tRNA synthetase class 1
LTPTQTPPTRLYFDVIPKNVDDYLAELQQFEKLETKQQLDTAIWHIHNGLPPKPEGGVTFSLLLNLV